MKDRLEILPNDKIKNWAVKGELTNCLETFGTMLEKQKRLRFAMSKPAVFAAVSNPVEDAKRPCSDLRLSNACEKLACQYCLFNLDCRSTVADLFKWVSTMPTAATPSGSE